MVSVFQSNNIKENEKKIFVEWALHTLCFVIHYNMYKNVSRTAERDLIILFIVSWSKS